MGRLVSKTDYDKRYSSAFKELQEYTAIDLFKKEINLQEKLTLSNEVIRITLLLMDIEEKEALQIGKVLNLPITNNKEFKEYIALIDVGKLIELTTIIMILKITPMLLLEKTDLQKKVKIILESKINLQTVEKKKRELIKKYGVEL